MDKVWAACEGYAPGTAMNAAALLRFFQKHSLKSQAFYVASQGATVTEITHSVALRESLDNLLDQVASSKDRDKLAQLIAPREPAAAPSTNRLLAMLGTALGRLAEWLAGIRAGAITRYESAVAPTELLEIEDRRGLVQNQMTVVSAIKPTAWPRVFTRLAFILVAAQASRSKGSLSGLTTIHFARWVIIDDGDYLLFESNYDGSWENYIDDFVDFASTGMNVIWGTAVDFPKGGARDIEAFKQIIRRYQVVTQVFYSAYPESTVRNNLNDLDLSRAIRKCCQDEGVRRFVTGTYGTPS
jgi:hypothetical protein